MVEHFIGNEKVASSILAGGSRRRYREAGGCEAFHGHQLTDDPVNAERVALFVFLRFALMQMLRAVNVFIGRVIRATFALALFFRQDGSELNFFGLRKLLAPFAFAFLHAFLGSDWRRSIRSTAAQTRASAGRR